MQLKLEWDRPILLTDGTNQNLIYCFDHLKVPESPGVYVFGRRYGKQFEALYVGKASDLRWRTKGQLNNVRLMQHLSNAKNGSRVLLCGRFVSRPGQQEDKCLRILERALIRYFLSEGHDLVNKQGARLRRHEIASTGSKANIPGVMFVDRSKSE